MLLAQACPPRQPDTPPSRGQLTAQVPSGLLADQLGGARLLLSGLLTWSLACLSAAAAPASASPFTFLLATRAALGLAQSVFMPGVSALAARWFDSAHRSRGTGTIYASFSAGSVLGLVLTPPLAGAVGWARAFAVLGAVGAAAAIAALARLPREPSEWRRKVEEREAAAERAGQPAAAGHSGRRAAAWRGRSQLALLIFAHSTISLIFFICQARGRGL